MINELDELFNFPLYEYETDSVVDELDNNIIGEIMSFSEAVNYLEQKNLISFTRELTNTEGLSWLYRYCVCQYLKSSQDLSLYEFFQNKLIELEEKFK